jgi:hypothetical protein
MDFISLRRRALQIVGAASLAAVLAASLATGATQAAKAPAAPKAVTATGLTGAWSGTYGGKFSGTFKLNWTDTPGKLRGTGTLKGTITITYQGQSQKTSVSGKVLGGTISFGAVGPVGVIKYTGTSSGSSSMSGKYTTPVGGGTWSANKTS